MLFAKLKRLIVAALVNCKYYPYEVMVFSVIVIWLNKFVDIVIIALFYVMQSV